MILFVVCESTIYVSTATHMTKVFVEGAMSFLLCMVHSKKAEYNACGILRIQLPEELRYIILYSNIYPKCTPCSDYPTAQ